MTVAMIGILAAAVVPAVVGQLQKGDVGRVGDDVIAIRGAVEQFTSDVRKYPASIGQLTTSLTANNNSMTAGPGGVGAGLAYNAGDVLHWKGPYLNKDSVSAASTAYNLTMTDVFVAGAFNVADSVGTSGAQKYLTLQIPSVDSGTARLLDRLYDDGVFSGGFIRWKVTASPLGTLQILLIPIQ